MLKNTSKIGTMSAKCKIIEKLSFTGSFCDAAALRGSTAI